MTMQDSSFHTVNGDGEVCSNRRAYFEKRISARRMGSSRSLNTAPKTFLNVSVDEVVGSLSLDPTWLIFSPDNVNPAKSWRLSSIQKHMVKERSLLVKVVFGIELGEREEVVFHMSSAEELKRLMKDIARRMPKKEADPEQAPEVDSLATRSTEPTRRGSNNSQSLTQTPSSTRPERSSLLSRQASSRRLREGDRTSLLSRQASSLRMRGEDSPKIAPAPLTNTKKGDSMRDCTDKTHGMDFSQSFRSHTNEAGENGIVSRVMRASTAVSTAVWDSEIFKNSDIFLDEISDDGKMEQALSDDIYSLLFTAHPLSMGFWFAVFTFACQISILCLIFLDLVDLSDDPPVTSDGQNNRFKIPAGVVPTVTVAQFIGIFLTINFLLNGGDLIKGFDQFCNGYTSEMQKQAPHATCIKWFVAATLQTCSGAMMMIDLVILSLQSTTVISFCLNFAALHFVQEIDDVAFSVASMGLISRRVQKVCLEVSEITIPSNVRKRTLWMRRIFIFLLYVGLYTGFFVLMGWQWSGVFRCKTVYVQFGDAFGPELSYYSGRFESYGNSWEGRPSFIHESGEIELIYWDADSAYVFKWANGFEPANDCNEGDYLIKSSETDTFDVVTIADHAWYANMQSGVKPMDWIAISCGDCTPSLCLAEHGTCVDNACQCNENHMGLFCEIQHDACNLLSLDYRTTGDLQNFKDGAFFMDAQFALVKAGETYNTPQGNTGAFTQSATVHERNIYYHLSMHAVVVFSGRRWIMFGSPNHNRKDISPQDFDDYLHNNNVANVESLDALRIIEDYQDFVPLYFSTPMDYNTPSDGYDFTGLAWFAAKQDLPEDACDTPEVMLGYASAVLGYIPDHDYPIEAQYLCSQCSKGDDCLNDGRCNLGSGVCECQYFYEGTMCEQTRSCADVGCANGGTCDPIRGICTDCGRGAAGNLCQYPLPKSIDPFFCSTPKTNWFDPNGDTWPSNGKCANSQKCDGLKQQCECEPPFFGNGCIQSTQATCYIDTPGWEDPCQNGGYCDTERYSSHPICVCPPFYSGEFCEQQN